MKRTLAIAFFLGSLTGLAATSDGCVEKFLTPLSDDEVVSRGCYQEIPLRLSWTTQSFPNLRDNPRRVQAWEGGFAKELTRTQVYLQELVDVCWGRVLSREQVVRATKRTLSFPVFNPNLSPDIVESYMLVPMTEAEARQEMLAASNRCSQP